MIIHQNALLPTMNQRSAGGARQLIGPDPRKIAVLIKSKQPGNPLRQTNFARLLARANFLL
jgi:hypothetical protein